MHPEILRRERLPTPLFDGEDFWQDRYRSIVDLEREPTANGTQIIKVFLHLSKEEQRRRFVARIDQPEKNWKFSLADVKEREFWKDYQKAYEKCLSATSTGRAPRYVVPADDKLNSQLLVSRITIDTFLQSPTVISQNQRPETPGVTLASSALNRMKSRAILVLPCANTAN